MTNTGKPYEILTKEVFEAIHGLHGVKTVTVQHDVKLQGKTRDRAGNIEEHQIDVYWEFEMGGVLYKTAIQCKDWASSVPQGEVIKFKGVLDDLPGQPRGMMVARTGFQSGAKVFAEGHGIDLYELRKPTVKDLKGRFVKLKVEVNIFAPSFEVVAMEPDRDWLRENAGNVTGDVTFSTDARDLMMYRPDGTPIQSVYSLLEQYLPKEQKAIPPTEFMHVFQEPTFIPTQVPELPKIKLDSLTLRMTVTHETHESEYDFADMLSYIVRNVSGDKTYFVDPSGNLRRSS